MTDNEIIKALDICIDFVSGGEAKCNDCPLHDCDNCSSEKLKSALNLINRQKAEIEKKDTEIEILIRKKHALRDEIEEKEAEILKLKSEISNFNLKNG